MSAWISVGTTGLNYSHTKRNKKETEHKVSCSVPVEKPNGVLFTVVILIGDLFDMRSHLSVYFSHLLMSIIH